jgi:hypothetical protein
VLWDRSHSEAAVCGLVPLPDPLEASSSAFLGGAPDETLAGLLADPAGASRRDGGTGPAALPRQIPEASYDGIPARN